MTQPVPIENDALKLEVWPPIGGKVSSILDKADGFELLFNFPAEIPTSPAYDTSYSNGWYAGWDECFPAVACSRYVGHPYDGIAVPDHGELWGVPATAVPTNSGITCVWHGLRFGYRLTRKLWIDGPSIHAEYSLTNLAPFDLRYVWNMHALLSMEAPMELLSEPGTRFRWTHDADGSDVQRAIEWPDLDGLNLSRPAELPAGKAWKLYGLEPIASPFVIRYPTRGRALSITCTTEEGLCAYWAVWINTGGWAKHRHLCVGPATGRFDQIDRAIQDHSAGRVGPLGRRDWTVTLTMS